MNWILIAILVTGWLFAIIGNLGWFVDSKDLKKTRRAYWKHRDANILLEEKYATLKDESNKMAAKYIASTGEAERLKAANTQYAETVVELNEEIRRLQKSADHATVPLAKRTPRKKAGQA